MPTGPYPLGPSGRQKTRRGREGVAKLRYVGGKARTAKRIASKITSHGRSVFLEPFMGGGSVSVECIPHFDDVILSDAHPDVAALWQAVASGWEPPTWVTKNEYERLKAAHPSPERAFAGFAASYNGKYFGGYGPEAKSAGRNYLDESRRSIIKKAPILSQEKVQIHHASYEFWNPDDSVVVYADPPYKDTTGYGGTDAFDTERFWRVMDEWVEAGALVYVSEYEAPAHWPMVSEFQRNATLHHAGGPGPRSEGLFFRER